jgi:iron complex outermembrane receptor protein
MKRDSTNARGRLKYALLGGAAAALLASAAMAQEAAISFDIAAQDAGSALNAFSSQSGLRVLFPYDAVEGKRAPAVRGDMTAQAALASLLKATGLVIAANDGHTVTLTDPQSQGAGGSASEVEALIVTAQKREEDIQDVPIAMSAFSQEMLEKSQIAGGPDLMTQIPNMTFTKTNFASYSIQLRGIGTQAISATTDAAVAVAFNNTALIRNRLFEQEFYDLARVEVLRGPQGTLYGRNATAGVVNIISAKPKFNFEAKASADLANYSSQRLEGMVNIPLVEDAAALRLAGAWTQRDGFVTNQLTGNSIDGRDLWSTRVSLRLAPNDAVDVNLIWEHFEEDDDRLRSGKQLCKRDDRTEIGGFTRPEIVGQYSGLYNQSCLPASLYGAESFQTPNGLSLPYFQALQPIGVPIVSGIDPYVSTTQSRDLRVIESTVDPQYRAESNVTELQISLDLTEGLSFTSETAYSTDSLFSMQDYNRFNTAPGAFETNPQFARPGLIENGVFCDPQIGCANRLVAMDLSTAESTQFSQELRLSSDYDGPFNFSLGGNFVRYDTEDKYYVFVNTLSMLAANGAQSRPPNIPPYVGGVSDNHECLPNLPTPPDVNGSVGLPGCIYIDPNPIGSLNDQGHNYFLSRNPYKLISYAVFGEAYYNITPDLKLTGGLRWTVDRKEAPQIPSWLLAGEGVTGYPVKEVVEQEWRVPTGRVALDWKPDLSFTDETLLYASFAHGYKAGGANPPPFGVVSWESITLANVVEHSASHPKTFEPEYIDAFEVGAKNTLLDGRLTLNLGAFYYDYQGYQISYIVDRSAVNLNFDAEVWGLEVEADWRPLDNLRLGFKGGYEKTRMADGSKAIDVMDRTAGHDDWIVARPFPLYPSNCIVPLYISHDQVSGVLAPGPFGDIAANGRPGPCEYAYYAGLDPVTRLPYVPNPTVRIGITTPTRPLPPEWLGYPGFDPSIDYGNNNGEGFYKDLSGNELPNAPHFTSTLTADYTAPLRGDWLLTLHGDLYWQSEAWTRIFNTEGYDKIKAYTNVNLAAIFANEDAGWKIMAYVKNVMDRDSITGAFLNSDDSGLTTNVFLTEPRLYGLRVTKDWSGGSLIGSLGARRPGGHYPLTVELGGQAQRHDAVNEAASPSFIGEFSPALNTLEQIPADLDWGDGREVKLTYDSGADWQASLSARFGKTNGAFKSPLKTEAGDTGCVGIKYVAPNYCDTHPGGLRPSTHWSQSESNQHEDHTVVDFEIGRRVGFGLFGEQNSSKVSLGLRYADFSSSQALAFRGITNWEMPVGDLFLPASGDRYSLTVAAERGFEGVGPTISWDASKGLIGDDQTGRLDIEWSLSGGVLFGKQNTTIAGQEMLEMLDGLYDLPAPVVTQVTPVAIARSESVTVPTAGASLGLSYSVDRVKLRAGYRWERYLDAIDGGYGEAQQYDRTIDGPYFTLTIGFGG